MNDKLLFGSVFLLDKPKGISSNQALQRIKHGLGVKKAGHTGTLDPMATGMLPICLGEATKLAQYLLSEHKTYIFTIQFGQKTNTGDADGDIIEQAHVTPYHLVDIEKVLSSFVGDIEQTPPMYSAIKQNGQPLYKLARQGKTVERKTRIIQINALEMQHYDAAQASLTLRCECASGTYIRVLAEDIAQSLQTIGHLTMLRRESVSGFERHDMYELSLSGAEKVLKDAFDERYFVPISSLNIALPTVSVPEAVYDRLIHGQRILKRDFDFGDITGECALYQRESLVGIGEIYLSNNHNEQLKMKRRILSALP